MGARIMGQSVYPILRPTCAALYLGALVAFWPGSPATAVGCFRVICADGSSAWYYACTNHCYCASDSIVTHVSGAKRVESGSLFTAPGATISSGSSTAGPAADPYSI